MIDKKDIFDSIQKAANNPDISVTIKDHKRTKIPPNVMVFQTFAYLAATKLNPTSNRILMLFIAISQYEGAVSMDIETIKEELKIKSSKTVVSALGELESHGVIIKVPYLKDKRRNEYYINPIAAWKGNGLARKLFMRETDPKQLKLFDVDAGNHVAREEKEIRRKKPYLSEWEEIERKAIEAAKGEEFDDFEDADSDDFE